jgi:hypothetical protein
VLKEGGRASAAEGSRVEVGHFTRVDEAAALLRHQGGDGDGGREDVRGGLPVVRWTGNVSCSRPKRLRRDVGPSPHGQGGSLT